MGKPVAATSSRRSWLAAGPELTIAAARIEDRPLGPRHHGDRVPDRVGGALRRRPVAGMAAAHLLRAVIGALGELDVLGDVDDDRARPAGRRDIEGLVQDAGEVVHVLHQPIVLGAGPRDADRVAFLEGVVADQVRRHLAGDADERDGIHHRVGQRRHHVGGARPGGDQRDAGLAGGAGIALGGVPGALLVADEDVLDLLLLEDLVVDRKYRAARIAENVLHALIGQRSQDHFGAGHLLWHRRNSPLGSALPFGQ